MAEEPRFLVTVAAIVRNEAPYIAEWIEYHTLIGVEHVYVYDNDSDDDLVAALRPYLLDGRATLLSWPDFPGQMSAYNHAVKVFGRDTRWMALLDIDEFIEVKSGEPLPEALDRYGAEADQILMPWVHFGASGHVAKPAGLVIESYVHRTAEAHLQPKTVVRPATVRWAGVHHCETFAGRTINGLGEQVPERWILAQPVDGPLRVNHYFTKSQEEFAAKIARGQADGGKGKTLADFNRFQTDVHDAGMAGWVEPVKQALSTTGRAALPANYAPRSAQSELTPSRIWNLAANEALALIDTALETVRMRDASLDHVILCADDLTPDLVAEASRLIADKVGGISGGGESGRPYAICRIVSAAATTLSFRVEGEDSALKPWTSERQITVPAGTSFLALILSPRVMRTDKVSVDSSEAVVDTEWFVFA